MRVALLLAAGLLLAGCVTPAGETPAGLLDPRTAPLLAAFDAAGLPVAIPDVLREGLGVTTALVGHRGAEPNVGVTSTGAVFMTAGHNTLRSLDFGATWEIVFNLTEELPQMSCPVPAPVPLVGCPLGLTRSSDPMLWVDTVTDRVFTNHMTGLYCSNMIISDDEGESWTMKPMTCGTPVNDHQKVATGIGYGPAHPGSPSPVYENPVYYCYNKLVATRCAVSLDGGLTFPIENTVAGLGGDSTCGGINGHPAPHPDGTMFVPLNLGCPATAVGVSEDSGLTWTFKMSPFEDVGAEEIDPEITVTPDGTAFMLWRGSDHLQYLARSTDKFDTWEGPWRVSPEGVKSTVFAGLTSGDDGKIAFAFLGTRDTDSYPSEAPDETRWHLYVGASLDAASANPTFVVEQITRDEDPVQIGCVWLEGGSEPCRNMLDFIDMHSAPDGRFYVAYTEGCVAASQHPGGAEHTGEVDCAFNPEATPDVSHGRHAAMAAGLPLLRAATPAAE